MDIDVPEEDVGESVLGLEELEGDGKAGRGRGGGRKGFAREVRQVLFGFGDDPTPDQRTVELLDDLVAQFLVALTRDALAIALSSPSSGFPPLPHAFGAPPIRPRVYKCFLGLLLTFLILVLHDLFLFQESSPLLNFPESLGGHL